MDLGQVSLVEERQLQVTGLDELPDLGGLERADELDPGLGERGGVGLGEHAAVAHHDHVRDPEAPAHRREGPRQGPLIGDVARMHRDRHRAALGRAGQPVVDLRLALPSVARVAALGQLTAAPLDVGRGEVVEHEALTGEVAAGERLFDPRLAL